MRCSAVLGCRQEESRCSLECIYLGKRIGTRPDGAALQASYWWAWRISVSEHCCESISNNTTMSVHYGPQCTASDRQTLSRDLFVGSYFLLNLCVFVSPCIFVWIELIQWLQDYSAELSPQIKISGIFLDVHLFFYKEIVWWKIQCKQFSNHLNFGKLTKTFLVSDCVYFKLGLLRG